MDSNELIKCFEKIVPHIDTILDEKIKYSFIEFKTMFYKYFLQIKLESLDINTDNNSVIDLDDNEMNEENNLNNLISTTNLNTSTTTIIPSENNSVIDVNISENNNSISAFNPQISPENSHSMILRNRNSINPSSEFFVHPDIPSRKRKIPKRKIPLRNSERSDVVFNKLNESYRPPNNLNVVQNNDDLDYIPPINDINDAKTILTTRFHDFEFHMANTLKSAYRLGNLLSVIRDDLINLGINIPFHDWVRDIGINYNKTWLHQIIKFYELAKKFKRIQNCSVSLSYILNNIVNIQEYFINNPEIAVEWGK
jgi:hypothetical protein